MIRKNFDLIYLLLTISVLIIDVITESNVIEGMAFVMIVLGFIFSVIPSKKVIKDERISYLKLFAGYIGFMLTVMMMGLIMIGRRYIGFDVDTIDLMRYIIMFMYLSFTGSYAFIKRRVYKKHRMTIIVVAVLFLS